jgi:4-carboxymuconolactone decarboxylase
LATPDSTTPPPTFQKFATRFPKLAFAHQQASDAALEAGPLDVKTCRLIKIGIAVGAGLDSAVRSHVRRAAAAVATLEEIEQTIVQAMTTCGFPRTVAAWSWTQEYFESQKVEDATS